MSWSSLVLLFCTWTQSMLQIREFVEIWIFFLFINLILLLENFHFFLVQNFKWLSRRIRNFITSSGQLGKEGRAKRRLFSADDWSTAWLVEEGTSEIYRKEIEKTQLGFIWEIWQELDIRNSWYCSIRMFIDNHTDSWSMCPCNNNRLSI